MFRLFLIPFLLFLIAGSFQHVSAQEKKVGGELIIMLEKNTRIEDVIISVNKTSFINGKIKAERPLAQLSGIWLLSFDSLSLNANEVLSTLKSVKGVKLAQFNHFMHLRATPDDTQFANQYALNNTGQGGGTVDADIDAIEAWDIATGGLTSLGDTIVVAVVDAGMQLTHPDLQFWKNYNEIAANSIDDDGNGFVDDVNGWNVFTHAGNIVNDQHGTHVCGIVGAKGNNNLGVSGVNWNVKIMPIVGATTVESQAVEAYSYILECRRLYNNTNGAKGAFVVASNSSFGVNQGQVSNFPIWCAMYDSLGKVGVLSAAATANNNWDIDVVGDIPCSCQSPYLITVSNSTRNDTKASNAAYGVLSIDMAAPGSSIYSTYPTSTYATLSGTSMASPHVAGAVALMYAAACDTTIIDYKLYPDSVSAIFKNILMNTVDQKQGFDTLFYSGGRLNVYNALIDLQNLGSCTANSIDEKSPRGLKIYPIPATDKILLEGLNPEFIESISIFNAGACIEKNVKMELQASNGLALNVEHLNSGYYMILVRYHQGNTFRSVFIKVK